MSQDSPFSYECTTCCQNKAKDYEAPMQAPKKLQTALYAARARLQMLKYEEENVKCEILREESAIRDIVRDIEKDIERRGKL